LKYHLNIMNFRVKKFIERNIQKREPKKFECYNLLDPME
jgi:hypothetical protein